MKTILFLLTISAISFTACHKKEVQPPELTITSFNNHAKGGENITISGTGFSSTMPENIVKINNVMATVVSGTTTSLVVRVPPKVGNGNINVTVNNKSVTSTTSFTYDWQWVVSTLAGGTQGYADGLGAAAKFNGLQGVTVDANNNLYVAEYSNNTVRKITPAGLVSTFAGNTTAGSTDGLPASAQFNAPTGLISVHDGSFYLVEFGNHRLRKIGTDGIVSTIAGSSVGYLDANGTNAKFNQPNDIALDEQGNIYVADFSNNRIRKVTPNGDVTTLAGSRTSGVADGTGTAAQFNKPAGITMAGDGNLYVSDYTGYLIRKVTLAGEVTTIAGSTGGYADGNGVNARFNAPAGMVWNPKFNALFVIDAGNNMVRMVTLSGQVTTIAGSTTPGYTEGAGPMARFNEPQYITIDSFGDMYVADYGNNAIRKMVYQ